MRKKHIQLLSTINVMIVVFCTITIPGEVENAYGTAAKYVALAVIAASGLIVAAVLEYCLRSEKDVSE